MESNFEYISGNYITEEKLCDITEITKDKLNVLIKNHLVPEASYVVSRSIKITSPLNDEFQAEITEKYFSKNCVSLIQKNKETKDFHTYKAEFREKFIQNLMKHPDRNVAYHNVFNNDQEKLEEIFESEWEAYCNGIYGICTINSTEEEIVKKEISVKKLIHFNTLFSQKTLNENETEELIQLNKEFNEVAERFAPYQRASSSRGKYLDKILESNSLSYLIKKY
ncbi:hypothetical protein EG344_04380 [Chryseobacterium sp. G0162]|uniref:DUF6058 family natural product biosynthesis protein n=1 Tax=Chryseobacterium sp. G0162 TaxID=2487063 RepID=UPI000F511D8B|nr:DUF6058 family natural product biosynthesis protein [Chryseobacterium sp. G0162]AZB08144.1 hypothetical protein EG344_04380 [Chryseobacterium sp. G0162]